MRTGLWMALVILVVLIVGGVFAAQTTGRISEQYISIGENLLVLVTQEDWTQAGRLLTAAQQQWRETLPWLCALVNHADAELITAAMIEVQAGVRVQDLSRAVSGALGMMTAAEALYQHDALRLENVL